ncbi:hypothetical protein ZOSMA_9G00020 [Zostera marina]|uniref:Uncharacterized protein n=1 Tax=Zostera marina TaxID=29655 RepID=A0A0K9NIJ5_ZOSMR|nr:hypothetical protein ZOSMA_9G00020 [Zostera marina]
MADRDEDLVFMFLRMITASGSLDVHLLEKKG